jgi:hypothetical protein
MGRQLVDDQGTVDDQGVMLPIGRRGLQASLRLYHGGRAISSEIWFFSKFRFSVAIYARIANNYLLFPSAAGRKAW